MNRASHYDSPWLAEYHHRHSGLWQAFEIWSVAFGKVGDCVGVTAADMFPAMSRAICRLSDLGVSHTCRPTILADLLDALHKRFFVTWVSNDADVIGPWWRRYCCWPSTTELQGVCERSTTCVDRRAQSDHLRLVICQIAGHVSLALRDIESPHPNLGLTSRHRTDGCRRHSATTLSNTVHRAGKRIAGL